MAPMSTTAKPHNHGTDIFLVAWVALVASAFAVCVKLGTRVVVEGWIAISLDGLLVLIALALAAGKTGALTVGIQDGIGDHYNTLSPAKIEGYHKTVYASQILYILSVCLAKLSIVAFFFQSTIGRAPRMLCGILGGVIISWGISTSFAIAFQCHLPQPWKVLNNACIDNRAFWYSVASIDVISDLCIIALPFYTLKFIQIPPRTRLQVIVPFCARLIVVPAAIMHAVLLSSSFHSTDSTYDDWKTILATIVETNVDIITACIPFSRLVASSVQSGLLNSDLRILAPVYNGIQEYSLTDPSARTKSAEESGTQSLTSRRPLKFWKPVGRDHGSTTH